MENKKNDLSSVEKGDRLWSSRFGWGTVKWVKVGVRYPIKIELDDKSGEFTITRCGRILANDLHPSTFWDEIKFDYPKDPKKKVKKTYWAIAHWDSKDGPWVHGQTLLRSRELAIRASEGYPGTMGAHPIEIEVEE